MVFPILAFVGSESNQLTFVRFAWVYAQLLEEGWPNARNCCEFPGAARLWSAEPVGGETLSEVKKQLLDELLE